MPHGFEGFHARPRQEVEGEEKRETVPSGSSEAPVNQDAVEPVSPESIRALIKNGRPVAAERIVERVADPRERAELCIELAAAQRAFSPTELLERGRAALATIEDPAERARALREYAADEIRRGFELYASRTIETIEDPQERFDAFENLFRHFWKSGTRVWIPSPGEILKQADRAAQDMGDAGQSADILTRLALISLGYRRGIAETYVEKIADAAERADAFITIADANRHNIGRADFTYLRKAQETLAQVGDEQRRAALEREIGEMGRL